MWFKPNKIPGTSIGQIHLPNSKTCPNCHEDYRKVKQIAHGNKVTYHCPNCGHKLNIKIPKDKKR